MQPTFPSAPASAPPSSALSAFLRGIERRAFVFAQVQCGRDELAEQALARTLQAFQGLVAVSPLSAWPAGFWSLLLAQPELGAGQSQVPELARLGSGSRAALLLRMVAGLDFAHAAQVLGVSEATYRFALQRALQQLGDAGVSYAALSGLRERLHRQVKTLPSARTDALAALRQRALAAAPEPAPVAPVASPAPPSPWLLRGLWAMLAALALGFAATFMPQAPVLDPGASEPLPDEPRPAPAAPTAARSDADLVSHPDYAQLAAPDALPVAAELALLSWLANQPALLDRADAGVTGETGETGETAGSGDVTAAPAPVPAFDAGVSPPSAAAIAAVPASFADLPPVPRQLLAPLGSAWPGLDAETRARLLANATHWSALDPGSRQALKVRMLAWDEQPAPQRARQRSPFAAWQRLPPAEQARLRAIAARFTRLPAAEQQVLRAQFDALPAEQRRDWWLGPVLGGDFAGLQPLVAFVPDDELAPVQAMLRSLSPESRTALAELSRRLPAGDRNLLREQLLAATPAEREALIEERLGR